MWDELAFRTELSKLELGNKLEEIYEDCELRALGLRGDYKSQALQSHSAIGGTLRRNLDLRLNNSYRNSYIAFINHNFSFLEHFLLKKSSQNQKLIP